jgi:hypothetical protein
VARAESVQLRSVLVYAREEVLVLPRRIPQVVEAAPVAPSRSSGEAKRDRRATRIAFQPLGHPELHREEHERQGEATKTARDRILGVK